MTPTPTPTRTLEVPTPYAVAQSIAPVHLTASSRPKADGIVLLLTGAVCAAMVGLLLLPQRAAPHTQTQIAVAPSAEVRAPESPPAETPPETTVGETTRNADVPAATFGTLITPSLADSHRVYLDGRIVGASGQSFSVACGPHFVRIGSAGRMQRVLVPCGGEIEIQAQW